MYSIVMVALFCTLETWDPVKDPEKAVAGATRARVITEVAFILLLGCAVGNIL